MPGIFFGRSQVNPPVGGGEDPTGWIDDTIMNYWGPVLSRSAEAALGTIYSNWQGKRDTWRRNNKIWTDTIAQYGYGMEGIFTNKRGGTADDLNDAYAYLTNYGGGNFTENHSLLYDWAIAANNGAPAAATYDTVLRQYVDFYYNSKDTVFLDYTDVDWTARYFVRGWQAMLAANYRGVAGGFNDRNYVSVAAEYKNFFINHVLSNGGFKASTQYALLTPSQTKLYTLGMILYAGIIHYRNVEQDATLLSALRTCLNYVLHLEYKKNTSVQFSLPYCDRQLYDSVGNGDGDWRDGDSGATNNGALPTSGMFTYALGYFGYIDRNPDYHIIGERLINAQNDFISWNNSAGWGIKEWEEVFCTGSFAFSYWKQKQALRSDSGVPRLVSRPTISGTLSSGSTITFNSGSWTNTPTSSAFRLFRVIDTNVWNANGGCNELTPTTPTTYQLTAADVGNKIYIVEKASNAIGASMPWSSAWTANIT